MNKISVYASLYIFSSCKSHNNQKFKKYGNLAGSTFRSVDPSGTAIGGRITGFIRLAGYPLEPYLIQRPHWKACKKLSSFKTI